MENPRPYVTAALLCERVIQEKNGTLSLIRIADRIGYQVEAMGGALPPGFKPVTRMAGLVGLKAGTVRGNHVVNIVAESPTGKRTELLTHSVEFTDQPDGGQNVILEMTMQIEAQGLYWFDVLFDGEILTRIPLTVVQEPLEAPAK
jgi:hypothetical protein